jgi:hypothetical protein
MPSGPACSSDRKHRSTCARIIANGVSGAHVTGLKWRSLNLRISAGYRRDSDDRGGAYFGLTGYVRM